MLPHIIKQNGGCFNFSSYKLFYCVTVASFAMDNNFKCKNCGHKYRTKNSLRTHIKIICGKPPQYMCDLCSQRTFKQKGNYKLHLLRVHNIMMY